MVNSTMNPPEITTATLEALGVLRRRIEHGREILTGSTMPDDRFKRAEQRLADLIRVYLNNLSLYREEFSPGEIRITAQEWYDRLEAGWAKSESDAVSERFSQVLSEYEVLSDCVLGMDITRVRLTLYLTGIHRQRAATQPSLIRS